MDRALRRKQLRDWYALPFPEDLFEVWELACRLKPDSPKSAFDAIPLSLCGPFDVLAGDFDEKPPTGPLWRHDMSYNDPPEFFTILWGQMDGYHMGWWFDDPQEPPTGIGAYYNNDAYEFTAFPANLFLTLRDELERGYEGTLENREYDPKHLAEYDKDLEALDALREELRPFLPGTTRRRKKKGRAYLDAFTDDAEGLDGFAETWGGEPINAPPHKHREPGADDETIFREVREDEGASKWLYVGRVALEDGFPATALKLGKDVRWLGPDAREAEAVALMCEAYKALGRPMLADVLRDRQEQRAEWDAGRKARAAPETPGEA